MRATRSLVALGVLVVTVLTVLALQWELIRSNPLLIYDDSILVGKLREAGVTSVSDYFGKISTGKIYDVQPLRDLSYYLDDLVGGQTHHLQNNLLWMAILLVFFFLLRSVCPDILVCALLVALFAFSPVNWNSLSWVSARKHLLSTFFILSATLVLVRSGERPRLRDFCFMASLYLGACLSQPINVGWPLFVAGWYGFPWRKIEGKKILLLSTLGVIFISVVVVNLLYYRGIFVKVSGSDKLVSGELGHLSYRLLVLGRSLWQVIFPYWPTPTSYYPGNTFSLVGMLLWVLLTFAVYKIRDVKTALFYVFLLLPISVFTVNMTNIFGTDSYLLIPSAGLLLMVARVLTLKNLLVTRWVPVTLAAVIVSYLPLTHKVARAWESDLAIFRHSYATDPSPLSLRSLMHEQAKAGEFDANVELGLRIMEWDPFGYKSDVLFANAIYKHPRLSLPSKKELLLKGRIHYQRSAWINYYLFAVHGSMGDLKTGYDFIRSVPLQNLEELEGLVSVVMAEVLYACEVLSMNCTEVRNDIDRIRSSAAWKQERFDEVFDQLKGSRP